MDLIVLKENRQQYEPSDEEITAYGEFLGLNFPEDDKYKVLLYEALTAPLPPDWEACETPQDHNLVFRNKKTQQVQQQHPLDAFYMQKIARLKKLARNLPIQTILEERQSWLKQSSELFGPSKNSADYSLKDQEFINEISEQKSIYDEENSQIVQQIPQTKKIIINKSIKTPRIYHRRKKSVPSVEQIRQRLLHFSFIPTFTTSQIKQGNYPEFQTIEQNEKLKSVINLNESIKNKRDELRAIERERKKKLEYLQILKNQIKMMKY